jgi:hypothetical protein
MIDPVYLTVGNVIRLDRGAIQTVIADMPRNRDTSNKSIKRSHYKIKIKGDNRFRRVYIGILGNTTTQFIESKGNTIYVEAAMDEALYRKEKKQ